MKSHLQRSSHTGAITIALAIAIGAGTIAIAQVGTCGTGPGQLNCFDPYAAGEMWRTIDPILERTTPDLDVNGNPDAAIAQPVMTEDEFGAEVILTNEVGDEVWETIPELDSATVINHLGPGECAYSHLGDPLESTRVCKNAAGVLVPPPFGKVLYPSGVAAYKHRVYVVDRMNHRVQVMNFDGQPLSIAKPIGNGEPGINTYTTLYPGQTVAGSRLNAPNGLAVDASGRLLIADGGNGRIALFNGNTGDTAFTTGLIHKTITGNPQIANDEDYPAVVPTSVAITPGANVIAPTAPPTAPPPGAEDHRIAVVDRWKCSLKVYDVGFNELWQYPAVNPNGSSASTACVEGAANTPVGIFSIMIGVAIDAAGHIYVVDAWNNRIQVFSKDGALLGAFGAPTDVVNPPVEALETPSSVLIDHGGRVVVNDSDNLRMAVYNVTYPTGAPVAEFLFEVPTLGDDHEEYPTALAEQWGTAADGVDQYGKSLDSAGRYLKVDTAGQRIQRLQLADLAIVQASASGGEGFFNVAVPTEKADAVFGTRVNVVPGELDEDGNVVNVPANVTVNLIEDISPGTVAADDIYPGQWVKYRFTWVDSNRVPLPVISFVITAIGNESSPQSTEAPPVAVIARGSCRDCDAAANVYKTASPGVLAVAVPTPTGDWYPERVYVRLTPTGRDERKVKFIEWQVSGSDVVGYGSGIHRTLLQSGARWVDVPFIGRNNDLKFWAVLDDETIGPKHTKNIKIDRDPPVVTFSITTPATGFNPTDGPSGTFWWNTDVPVPYTVTDDASGTTAPPGTILLTGQGRNLTGSVTASDRVGNSTTAVSNAIERGGKVINIDRVGPVITPPANLFLIAGIGGSVNVPASFANGASVTDNLSGVNGGVTATGPATVTSGQTVTWTFTATDWAGNSSTATATVTAAGASLIYTGPVTVEYGLGITLSAHLEPTDARGDVRFTLVDPVRGNRVVTGTLVNGIATAPLPMVINNVGTYPLVVEYVGTDVAATSVTTSITISKAPFVVVATAGQTKNYGDPDPASYAYTLPRLPFHPSDTIVGALSRVAGETAGTYPITVGSFNVVDGKPCLPTCTSNYFIVLHSQLFTIVHVNTPPTARPDSATVSGAASVYIPVLSNDTDADNDPLTISNVTQPAVGGSVTLSGNQVRFTPTVGFVGTTTFTYTVADGQGGFATATVTVTVTAGVCSISGFTTFTQGGWGGKVNGGNPAQLLDANFAAVYPTGVVRIGGLKSLRFTSAQAISAFLPAGGTAAMLNADATDAASSSAGVFAGQVLALQLNVDFSRAGIKKVGLGELKYGAYSVNQILNVANEVLGGNVAALSQLGLTSISQLNTIVDNINNNFDNGANRGFLRCP